ncbi:MAG: cell division protein SepF [Clostridiales bacterium]|nr:cell division protein SepF [Clostridiales bacterium]
MGSFMDKVYNLVGVDVGDTYEEEYYDDYADEDMYDEPQRNSNESYMPSRRNSVRNSARVNRYEDNPQMKLVIMRPEKYEEATDITNYLKERKPIVINLEAVDTPTSRRIVDFISGAVYALDGNIQKVSKGIFLIAPCNIGVLNDRSSFGENWG